MLILTAKLYGSITFRLVSQRVGLDREFVSKTNDVANLMQERVLQIFAFFSIRQGEVIAANVFDLVGEEGSSERAAPSAGVGLVVDDDEVGYGTIGCAVDGHAEVDGVPFVCSILEGLHGVVEIGVTRETLADAEVPVFTISA